MFKKTILFLSFIGLISGSAHASSDTTNTKENVQTLAQSFSDDARKHDFLAFIGAVTTVISGIFLSCIVETTQYTFDKPYNWNDSIISYKYYIRKEIPFYTDTEKLAFYEREYETLKNAGKTLQSNINIGLGVVVCGALFAIYHLSKRETAKKRADTLNNIGTALEQEEAAL